MIARKPPADLELCFPGEGVYPEKVPVRYLAEVIAAIHRIVSPEDEEEGAPASIRLIDVRRGSAVFRCVAQESDTLLARLKIVAENLEDPERADALGPALGPLRRLSDVAASLCSPVIVRRPGSGGIIARFEPDTYENVSRHLLISGEKSVSGNVQRVGGATGRRCLLRIPGRDRILYCDVASDEAARTLGTFLYQDVTVTGVATWLRKSWDIVDFTIHGVVKSVPGSLAEAFDALRTAGGADWDQIEDPESYVEQLSGKR